MAHCTSALLMISTTEGPYPTSFIILVLITLELLPLTLSEYAIKAQKNSGVTRSNIEKCAHDFFLSYDVTSGGEIMPCFKIDKPLVVYRI